MGKRLNDFKEKICKNGTPCGNSCISKLKNCLKSKKTGDSAQPGKTTKKDTNKPGDNSAQKKDTDKPGKTTLASYKADSADHKALIAIGKEFSDQTMGKALKSLDDALAEKKSAFLEIMGKNKFKKNGDIYKRDQKRLQELDEKTLLAQKEFESAARETMRRIAAHHKIDREDAERWADSVDTRGLTGENKEITSDALVAVYALTGGKGAKKINKVTSEADRASANPNGELKLEKKIDRHQIFHEYAHYMEFENRQLAVASRKFIEDRATSTEPMKLKDITGQDYRDTEMAFSGNFIDPYVGKIYGSAGTPTEVISMGVELFRDPKLMSSFYKQDPEHFNFVLGAILHEN
jgi:hypothetical protein